MSYYPNPMYPDFRDPRTGVPQYPPLAYPGALATLADVAHQIASVRPIADQYNNNLINNGSNGRSATAQYQSAPTVPIQYHGSGSSVAPAMPAFCAPYPVTNHHRQHLVGAVAASRTDALGLASSRDEFGNKRKHSELASLPMMSHIPMANSRKYAYKLATMREIYQWYMVRQQIHLLSLGNRGIVENLIIYLEGLKVTYRSRDISITENTAWTGDPEAGGGPGPADAFRDNLKIYDNFVPTKTSSFINDTVTNFLHTGTLGSLCMIETISSYFIPVCKGSGLSPGEIYEGSSQNKMESCIGYKKLNGGYTNGECGTLTIHSDGSYSLTAYGIILVIGSDFVAATCKAVRIERSTTSSIRLLHPGGHYSLPKHVLRYPNRPIDSKLQLPSAPVPGTAAVYMTKANV